MSRIFLCKIFMLLLVAVSASHVACARESVSEKSAASPMVNFRFQVLPVLSKNCFACHGMDEAHREAGLRLDVREDAVDFGAIVSGAPEESELVRRIESEDPDERMPPPETGKELTESEIELIKQWIATGAKYSKHWSYEAPRRPPLPRVSHPEWCRNEIDYFILSDLEQAGLTPESEADPYRLIRRLSLDLTGLPPSVEEANEFALDPSPGAYERMVDRLLESPAYGEHWARKWLDLARYADTCGYEKDSPRTIWPFRDWVIQALNDDMPFDQFTIEQLAGDLLPNPTKEQIIATAFHRNTMQNDEEGADDEEFRVAAVVDRVSTTMQVWMGTTMGCARCHSHKYDPFTQREFYELFAFFNQTADADRLDQEPLLVTPSPEDEKLQSELEELLSTNESVYERLAAASKENQVEWEAAVRSDIRWQPLIPSRAIAETGQNCEIAGDASVVVSGEGTSSECYEVDGVCNLSRVTALKLQAYPEVPNTVPGDIESFVLSRIRVLPGDLEAPNNVRFARLDIPNRHQYLKMAEVQLFQGEKNVALGGTATQSSTAYEGRAQLAIDGSTDPDYAGGRSTSHTAFDFNPWWEVDLGKPTRVERVSLWASAENQDRLKGARFTLMDASRKPVWQQTVRFAPDMSATLFTSKTTYPQIILAGADSELAEYPAMHAIKNLDVHEHGWSPDPQSSGMHSLVVGFETPWEPEGPLRLKVRLEQHDEKDIARPRMRHFRMMVTDDPRAAQSATVPPEIRQIAHVSPEQRTEDQSSKIAEYYRFIQPELRELLAQRKDIELRMTEELDPDKTPIMKELPLEEQRTTHVMIRGNFLDWGEVVEPGTPHIFPPMPSDAPRNRLGLARWLVNRQNPLTARVVANRQWEQLFGIGLVRTSEDFGSQGTLPSNPALLDWLAIELMDHDWSLKHLTKKIVMSAAYRQSGRTTAEKRYKDPDNLLISRGPSNRLTAEQMRDQALFVAGLLSRKMYGPSVMPYQPEGVWQTIYSDDHWEISSGEDRYRRGLYTYWRRTSPYSSAMALDATSRETCTIRRITTNTPVAAFALLNDPAYVEAARNLAEIVLAQNLPNVASRADFAFRRVLIRPPTEKELNRVVEQFHQQEKRYQQDLKAAKALTMCDGSEAEHSTDLPALAAWTVVSNVLLNLDETQTK